MRSLGVHLSTSMKPQTVMEFSEFKFSGDTIEIVATGFALDAL
jgi:hypothetical protein